VSKLTSFSNRTARMIYILGNPRAYTSLGYTEETYVLGYREWWYMEIYTIYVMIAHSR